MKFGDVEDTTNLIKRANNLYKNSHINYRYEDIDYVNNLISESENYSIKDISKDIIVRYYHVFDLTLMAENNILDEDLILAIFYILQDNIDDRGGMSDLEDYVSAIIRTQKITNNIIYQEMFNYIDFNYVVKNQKIDMYYFTNVLQLTSDEEEMCQVAGCDHEECPETLEKKKYNMLIMFNTIKYQKINVDFIIMYRENILNVYEYIIEEEMKYPENKKLLKEVFDM
jgi:hypothetical protein